jgi:hypothetical protein
LINCMVRRSFNRASEARVFHKRRTLRARSSSGSNTRSELLTPRIVCMVRRSSILIRSQNFRSDAPYRLSWGYHTRIWYKSVGERAPTVGGAGLFNLSAAFKFVGEPFQGHHRICYARYSMMTLNPTGLSILVQDVG